MRYGPHAGGLRDAYDEWHAALPEEVAGDSPWHQLVLKHLGTVKPGGRMLEIGCGGGGFSTQLAKVAKVELVAADFSPVAVAQTQRLLTQQGLVRVTAMVEDIQALTFADSCFDTVISCETIEHVPDPCLAVGELARVLKPGGRLFLTTPNYLSLQGVYRAYLWGRRRRFQETGQPRNNLTLLPRTLHWIRTAGLSVETVDGDGWYLPMPNRDPRRLHLSPALARILRPLALHSLIVARK